MKKAKTLLVLLILFTTTFSLSAADSKWEIKGIIIEEQSGETLPYVTVTLNNIYDSTLITGTITNESGEFILEKVSKGNYYIEFSFVGFEDFFVQDLKFGEDVKTIDVGSIKMHPASALLGEVEISTRVSPVSNSIDKQVINVEKNLSAIGGTAADALRLSPSIQVDGDGHVKLRGSSNFIVLINGKPTTLKPDEVLRQTPANMISKVEVITNPSVKYNAEGGAGVINIILKKGAQSGLNGMVNASVGTKGKYSGDINLNLNRNKVSLSLGIDYRDWDKTALNNYYRDMYNNDTVNHASMLQDRNINESNLGVRFGLDNNPNDKSNFAYSFHGGYSTTQGTIEMRNSDYTEPEGIEKYSFNVYNVKQKPTFYTNNFSFNQLLKRKGSSISVNAYYSYIDYYLFTSQSQSISDNNLNSIDSAPYLQDILNDNYSHDYRLDVDYVLPISEKTTLETGGSSHHYMRFLDITYASFDHESGEWVNHPDYTNKYDFNESVYAAYANVNTSFWGISASIGLRTEYMDRLLGRQNSDSTYAFDQLHFFPAFSFSKALNEKHSIKLAMSNRINRPDEYMMNPFPEFEDDYFYSEGNPFLIPEIVRNIELGYQFASEKNVITSNLYYRQTTDKIEQRLWIEEDNKIHTSFHNNCKDKSIGLELMGNFDLFPWWSLNASGSLYHYTIEGYIYEDPFKRQQVSWNVQAVNSFNITKSTSLQLIGYYNSPTVRSQGQLSDFYFVDVAVKQQFLDGRLSINVQLKDILQSMNYQLTTETGNMNLNASFNNESPILLFSVSYQISNYKKKTKDVDTEFDM